MYAQMKKSFLTVAGALLILTFAAPNNAALATCYSGDRALPPEQVSSFLANPNSLLSSNPTGGAALIARIRDLVASDAGTLEAVVNMLRDANADQKAAIGSGLGQAATVCLRTDREFASRIQQAVARSGSPEAILAYTSTTGGISTAAVGGGAGSPGGVGGPVNTGSSAGLGGGTGGGSTGGAQQFGTFSTNSGSTNYFTGLGVSGSSAISRASRSVSQ